MNSTITVNLAGSPAFEITASGPPPAPKPAAAVGAKQEPAHIEDHFRRDLSKVTRQ